MRAATQLGSIANRIVEVYLGRLGDVQPVQHDVAGNRAVLHVDAFAALNLP